MSETPPLSTGDLALGMDALCASINRVAGKIQVIAEAVQCINQNRVQLEGKIEQSDGRQLNLLGEAIPPNNPEDDNEPTTH